MVVADTIERMDPDQLQLVASSLAVWAISIANLPELLPRAGPVPPMPTPTPTPGDKLTGGAIAGIILGPLALIAALSVGCYVMKRRKRVAVPSMGHNYYRSLHLPAAGATPAQAAWTEPAGQRPVVQSLSSFDSGS